MTENEAISELEKFQIQVEHSIAEEECCEYDNSEKELQKDEKFLYAFDMAISALKEIQQYREIGSVGEIKQAIGVLSLSENDIIKTFHELNEYREIGTVEQVKNQKENLNVAYQIISDYEQYGTIEDFKKAQRYMHLVNAHGTIGRVIDSCAEYESIGTVEECREAVEKQKPKKPILRNDNGKLRKSCPVCGCFFSPLSRSCPKCGQAIDENLEGMDDGI